METAITDSRKNAIKVLLVEDDDGDAKAFLRAFEKAEITNPIIRVLDGVAAFEVLRGTNGNTKLRKPYVIISDINMPRMDGITFLQKLREDPELKKSVVFMLTTSDAQGDIYLSYASHTAGYIRKHRITEDFLSIPKLISAYWNLVELPK
ncbi:MAG: two-component system response regulator [Micavibrio sp. TMED27]|nr:two-component system response regulator [Micavibrio sp.]OUT92125.1 MAG: two-component system response regulator [Micavibrio sp. TMED27]|tara:strand:- start:369 stop:818 length:450 start_codon:yes stop_codon:yes gene_type:complete